MRNAGCWLLLLLLTGVVLGSCSPGDAGDATPRAAFEALARRLPADVENAFFLDFKPDDPMAQHWAALRRQLEQSPATQQLLADLLARFRVEAYALQPVIEGPAAAAQWGGATVVLLPVQDEAAAWERMVRNLGDAQSWAQETVQGKLIYHGRFWDVGNRPTYLAWTMDEDLLCLAHGYDSRSIELLSDLLGLAQGATLSALDSWEVLRQRLPDAPLAVAFFPVAELASRPSSAAMNVDPTAAEEMPPTAALERHLEALVLAVVPEGAGLRIEVQGVFGPDAGDVPALEALFGLPAIEPAAWNQLPAGTAAALLSHDAAVIWPWVSGVLGLNLGSSNPWSAAVGLDLEADLLSAEGPLQKAFALAFMPPQPDQPVIQGLPALQALLLSGEVTPTQVEALAGTLEERGAVWGTTDLDGLEVHTQVGTQLSGYALSFGLDDDTLVLATSPEVIGQAMEDRQRGSSLLDTGAFQAILSGLPGDAFLVSYLDSQRFVELIQANAAGEQDGASEMIQFLQMFEAMGAGFRLESEGDGDAMLRRIEGAVYFLSEE